LFEHFTWPIATCSGEIIRTRKIRRYRLRSLLLRDRNNIANASWTVCLFIIIIIFVFTYTLTRICNCKILRVQTAVVCVCTHLIQEQPTVGKYFIVIFLFRPVSAAVTATVIYNWNLFCFRKFDAKQKYLEHNKISYYVVLERRCSRKYNIIRRDHDELCVNETSNRSRCAKLVQSRHVRRNTADSTYANKMIERKKKIKKWSERTAIGTTTLIVSGLASGIFFLFNRSLTRALIIVIL